MLVKTFLLKIKMLMIRSILNKPFFVDMLRLMSEEIGLSRIVGSI